MSNAKEFKDEFRDIRSFLRNHNCKCGEDCCIRRYLVDYTPYNQAAQGKNRFTDIDAVLRVDEKVLFVEFKSGRMPLTSVQKELHRTLSRKKEQSSLIVWHDQEEIPLRIQRITHGVFGPIKYLRDGKRELVSIFKKWTRS